MTDYAGQRRFSGQRTQVSNLRETSLSSLRPLPVTLIALLQFAKALFLALVVWAGRFSPQTLYSFPSLPAFLYFASHGRAANGTVLPVVAAYTGLIGLGLWLLWGWARRSLIFSSVLMIALWGYRFYSDWTVGAQTLKTPLEEQTIYFLIFIDVVIVLYLAFYDGVSQAFEGSRF